jgi:aspartyl-tRNA(Asn)/glutamyl-tRNA(Gln) amidotransferase subunit C
LSISRDDIQHIAHLARLEMAEADVPEFASKLTDIIDMVNELAVVDTAGVVPMSHPLDMGQRLRPDEVTETVDRDTYQQNASEVEDGLYRVPRVIE